MRYLSKQRARGMLDLIIFSLFLFLLSWGYKAFFDYYESVAQSFRGEKQASEALPSLLQNYKSTSGKKILVVDFLNQKKEKVEIKIPSKHTHSLILGRSGSGKSTLIESICSELMLKTNDTIIVCEPHGSLAQTVCQLATLHQKNLYYLSSSIEDEMMGAWAPQKIIEGLTPQETASFVVGSLSGIFSLDSFFQTKEVLLAGIELLLPFPLDLFSKIFYDNNFKDQLLKEKQPSEFCLNFFERFDSLSNSQKEAKVLPAINKLALLTGNKQMNLLLGQNCKQSLDLDSVINTSGNVIVVNLNKKNSEHGANILGSLFISAIKQAVFRRDLSQKLPMIHAFVDEFPSFCDAHTLSILLAESRKFSIQLYCIAQFLGQITDQRFKNELIQNTERQWIFDSHKKDAQEFGKTDKGLENELLSLKPFHLMLFDKKYKKHAKAVTKPLTYELENIKPNYLGMRPVSEVEKEIEEDRARYLKPYKTKAKPPHTLKDFKKKLKS